MTKLNQYEMDMDSWDIIEMYPVTKMFTAPYELILDPNLSPTESLILIHIHNTTHRESGWSAITNDVLAELIRVSKSTIQNKISSLKGRKYIMAAKSTATTMRYVRVYYDRLSYVKDYSARLAKRMDHMINRGMNHV
ncbi:hypothetical protein LCGC14_2858460 [marine sediment metagenome]|uniref:Uncharacterized protein n=1 Tax=marine sediment metagenome TaxID=412755 RepID=A0A0F9AET4_9ZZZZ